MRSQNRVNRKHRLTPYGQYLLELGLQHKRSSNRGLGKQMGIILIWGSGGGCPGLLNASEAIIPSNLIKISFHPSFLRFVFRPSDIKLRVLFEATSVVSHCARSFRTYFASRRSIF